MERESVYRVTAADLKQAIPIGTTRSQVELLLRQRSQSFELRSGRGTHDELVTLAHEASPKWYCNYEQVQVLIKFTADEPTPSEIQTSTGFSSASPQDRVNDVRLDHWERDCI